jgi:hypothetical protein
VCPSACPGGDRAHGHPAEIKNGAVVDALDGRARRENVVLGIDAARPAPASIKALARRRRR